MLEDEDEADLIKYDDLNAKSWGRSTRIALQSYGRFNNFLLSVP